MGMTMNSDGKSVTFTIPITVSVQLGTPEIQQITGKNWDRGWYAYCSTCRCNRHLILYAEYSEARMGHDWLAYCNVCDRIVPAPSYDGKFVDMPTKVSRIDLDRQRLCPLDCYPPPSNVLKKQ